MAKDNINPNHYKFGNFETIDLIQEVVEDFGSVCQANILKYGIRANRKHDNPKDDINKIIRYCEFWLNDIEGVKASEKRSEETNHQEEDFSPFDKLRSLLNDQEKELLKDKNIKVIHINGLRMLEDFIKEKEDRRNGKHEANR
nr:MAG TPA: nucelotide kinase [Caudoviricetes sp.]